jgi:hypothetical protein
MRAKIEYVMSIVGCLFVIAISGVATVLGGFNPLSLVCFVTIAVSMLYTIDKIEKSY